MMDASLIEIRTFSSPEEIRELPNFIENNPINKTNYKRLIGDYNYDEEVCCCFEKENGNLCGEPHKRGWVAELLDGSATIIGNHCAQEQFGADSRLIADKSKYVNEKRRRERLAAILVQIGEKPQRLEQLDQLRSRLESLEQRIEAFTEGLSPTILRRLQDMARTGQSVVSFTAVKFREYIDEDGRSRRERSAFEQSLGALDGLPLVLRSSFYTIYDAMRDVRQAYEEAEQLGTKPKSAEVDSLANRLNDYERIVRDGNRLLDLERAFFANNFLPLCFLETDKTERYKAARVAMRRSGIAGSKDDAKAWLAEQEKAIKQQLSVDAIEIR
ncbi:hypothetical protein [Burkholderia ubonensis]|uniref:hypothetical protein n=1 Tax=Burkholderia ubonensis TaxID=101571 RepID=UPI0008FDB6CA|nr:hypothetical protein [Burkholderia ubonensis]OJA79681.1 hypothetical protein BGV48_33640 [Burkholderia ubonensis]